MPIRPLTVDDLSYLGRSYEAVGRVEEARGKFREAIGLTRAGSVRSADPPPLLGTLLYRQRQLSEASEFLREALEHELDSAMARYWLGLLFERRARNEAEASREE